MAGSIDFALGARKDNWLHHPVYGEPSWDAFERRAGNPVWRGVDGLEWPVNGFLFQDPVSGGWFLFIGHYPAGYALGPGKRCFCTVSRSDDQGGSWRHLGPVFADPDFRFDGDEGPSGAAPDVTVVYAEGRYHMAYDWVFSNASWRDAHTRRAGVGYAWSERPEGPYHRHPTPILRNDAPAREPILGKYNRLYGSTLIRRSADWLLLTITDSGPYFAWGLVGMTAQRPEGPYNHLTPLFHVEGDGYQPPLMEYFPSFVHDGWLYAPSTSVALNRNFQMIHRCRLEEAMHPGAWEIAQHGSIWHGESPEHESHGIWGQTLTGFVDSDGRLHVMYPSKDRADRGTINLASRPWNAPWLRRGLRASGHGGPSLVLLRVAYDAFRLEAELELTGAAALFWSHSATLRPDAPRSNASLHPHSLPRGPAVRLDQEGWRVLDTGGTVAGSGRWAGAPPKTLLLERANGGRVKIMGAAETLWEGQLASNPGTLGFLVEGSSTLSVGRFLVTGEPRPAVVTFLASEALLGAGQDLADWVEVDSPLFRHGYGAERRAEGGRAKWNFFGTGFTLYSPRGPEYGDVELLVDGRLHERLELRAAAPVASSAVCAATGLPDGLHAVVLRGMTGRLVVDALEVTSSVP